MRRFRNLFIKNELQENVAHEAVLVSRADDMGKRRGSAQFSRSGKARPGNSPRFPHVFMVSSSVIAEPMQAFVGALALRVEVFSDP